ncbi:MAG TPA: hypothetical protein VE975_05240 [Actinomycetota bacterium]|jgi:hypothetical protein|nr:hypothetical protein [Actinomycetota bacterium]
MLPGYRARANIGVGAGLAATAITQILLLTSDTEREASRGEGLALLGILIGLWGGVLMARGKGRNLAWALLALLAPLGLVALFMLEDKHLDKEPPPRKGSRWRRRKTEAYLREPAAQRQRMATFEKPPSTPRG